jgi:prepilin-type N-terminal cleavage/methylation domain-containing protein
MSIRRQLGFTLIELLVVVAIIALLISILLPALGRAKAQARTVVCLSNMKQLAMAFIYYTDEYDGHLPGGDHDAIFDRTDPHAYQTFSWLGTHPEVNYIASWGERVRGSGGSDPEQCPKKGTLFPYAGQNAEVYACPADKRRQEYIQAGSRSYRKPSYSYTSPKILTGVSIFRLEKTWYPDDFEGRWLLPDWGHTSKVLYGSRPWLGVEEDEVTMSRNDSAGWSSTDGLSDRHYGQSGVFYVDGGANHQTYQREPKAVEAQFVYFELGDGRVVSAGSGADVRMNDLFLNKNSYPSRFINKP